MYLYIEKMEQKKYLHPLCIRTTVPFAILLICFNTSYKFSKILTHSSYRQNDNYENAQVWVSKKLNKKNIACI